MKDEQVATRVDTKIVERINAAVDRGDYSSKSDFLYRAILTELDKVELKVRLKAQLLELLTSDEMVAAALQVRLQTVLSRSLSARPVTEKVDPDHTVKTPGLDDP